MNSKIKIGNFEVSITKKKIKNIYLSVNPPNGIIKISAPEMFNEDAIRSFALTKLEWIKRKHFQILNQLRESKRSIVSGESYYVWGKRYLIKLIDKKEKPYIKVKNKTLSFFICSSKDFKNKQKVLENFLRNELRKKSEKILLKWERQLNVSFEKINIRRMKTKWGSCDVKNKIITLNTELIHKPLKMLEYIIVHELIHLIEPKHNNNFFKILSQVLPDWKITKIKLNKLPLTSLISKKSL